MCVTPLQLIAEGHPHVIGIRDTESVEVREKRDEVMVEEFGHRTFRESWRMPEGLWWWGMEA